MLDREAERLAASSGYGSKLLPLPLYAGELVGGAWAVSIGLLGSKALMIDNDYMLMSYISAHAARLWPA
eukprot:1137281-Pelagomonas_calceolata.AAC.8